MSSLPPLSPLDTSHRSQQRQASSHPKASSPDGHSSVSSSSASASGSPGSLGSGGSSSSYYTSPSSNQSNNDDEEEGSTEQLVRWTKKPRRKRSGWGPYKSVLNERSVDFNLTLDVQTLKSEIQHLEMHRDILASKTLIRRHDPEGSLVRIAQEHYRIFRTGFNLQQTGRKRLSMNERDQKEFLYSIFDENVDCGGEQNGIHVMIQQIMLYTVFIKAIAMTMTSFEVIVTEDSVIVATKGILHFQILRNTIAGMFPHVLGEEWLVSKLVGKEVAPESGLKFYFNKRNKVIKFVAELDYVKTFSSVLDSPEEVDILLGRSLVTENCLIIPNDDDPDYPSIPPTDPPARAPRSAATKNGSGGSSSPGSGFEGDIEDVGTVSSTAEESDHSAGSKPSTLVQSNPPAPTTTSLNISPSEPTVPATAKRSGSSKARTSKVAPLPTSSATGTSQHDEVTPVLPPQPTAKTVNCGPMTPLDHFSHVVQAYFQTFAHGSHANTDASITQFLNRYFSPSVQYGDAVGRQIIHDRWRSLSWCFDLQLFRQMIPGDTPAPVAVYEPQQNRYRMQTRAEYTLQLTVRTLELVFPHVVADLALVDSLVGSRVTVASELSFWLERGTGLLARVSERMAFDVALGKIVSGPEDLAFVLQGAAPILTSFVGVATAPTEQKQTAAGDVMTNESSSSSSTSSTSSPSLSQRSTPPSSPEDSQSSETEAKMRLSAILG